MVSEYYGVLRTTEYEGSDHRPGESRLVHRRNSWVWILKVTSNALTSHRKVLRYT